jgi:alpha-beta hydrolase superfamily lysophospholipase
LPQPLPADGQASFNWPDGAPHDNLAGYVVGNFIGSKGTPIPYIMTVPRLGGDLLAIYQHGLGQDKSSVFAIADTMGRIGRSTVAIDLPLHGDRAVAGRDFLDLTNLPDIKENMLEAAADLVQLVRTAQGPSIAGHLFRGTPAFIGVSMGGCVGGIFLGAPQPVASRVLMSTSGAPLVDMVLDSPTLRPRVNQALAQAGIQPNSQQFEQFLDLARWTLDVAEPTNYASQVFGQGGRQMLMQVATGDGVMPPNWGRRLAAAIGAQLSEYPGAGHEVLVNLNDGQSQAAQNEMAQFFQF